MQQAEDFGAESAALADMLETLAPDDWRRPTRFKGWTPDDVLVHLHFWNRAQDLALTDPDRLRSEIAAVGAAMAEGRGRAHENGTVRERGRDLLAAWRAYAADMAERWRAVDPKRRLPWVGPDMSARSAMTARQMETWAHGQAIYDLMGLERAEHDRIRNIVFLGVGAFAWSFHVQGLPKPAAEPCLRLTAPSGALWEYGAPRDDERIVGPAVDFARVVTQTRNVADTALDVTGPTATLWMRTAQCFAGPRERPPAPGERLREA